MHAKGSERAKDREVERERDRYIHIERERAKNASISAKLRPIHWDGEHEVV